MLADMAMHLELGRLATYKASTDVDNQVRSIGLLFLIYLFRFPIPTTHQLLNVLQLIKPMKRPQTPFKFLVGMASTVNIQLKN